ncbi:MAG: hypothetical protein ACYSWQ_24695 [Planctomycetota bacterium]|jgi:hypothetical protein
MAGLNHDFLVIETGTFSLDDYEKYQSSDRVELHDDFLRYIGDSISWFQSYNPCLEEECVGLCWYGPTIIQFENIEKVKFVFQSWLSLLSLGPETLRLRGAYTWTEGEPESSGAYEELEYRKSEIVDKMEELVSFCTTIQESNGAKCLLHLGI